MREDVERTLIAATALVAAEETSFDAVLKLPSLK
jgi:hypothetical protein